MRLKYYFFVLILFLMNGCALPPTGPPVAENFVFNPPSSVQSTKNSMSIAILMPGSKGNFFQMYSSGSTNSPMINNFLSSYRTDLEKIILAKGFTSSGVYPDYDEMTFSQKENSTLVMRPEISFNINVQRGLLGEQSIATVNGSVVVEFLEPMSQEKIWIKHFDLPQTTQPVQMKILKAANGRLLQNPDGSLQYGLSSNSATELLNSFYASAFKKIWDQLDSREIAALKSDADKVKKRTNYRAN
jgi:hypothetical protein